MFFLSVVIGESAASSHKPVYIEPMSNETVAVGRDATLQCVVKHLQDYKVSPLQIIICRRSTERLSKICFIKVFSFKISMIKWNLYDLLLLLISNKIQVSTELFFEK